MGIEFQKFSHLGFIKPVPKKERRSQVSSDFDAFVVAYKKSGKRYRNVRGHEMVSVMHLLRSMPPTHCWKGSMVIKEMKKWDMGEQKVRAVLSCLNQCGWIRYHKVVRDKQYVSSIMEVMFLQLPQDEVGIDHLIKLDDEGRPSIFRRVGKDWMAVSDSNYPPNYTADPLPDRGKAESEAEPLVWVPSEWKSSERVSDERQASPVYKKDDIGEDLIQIHPISPLSAKGDASVVPSESDEAEESFARESGSVRDSTSSSPGRSLDLDRLVLRFVELGVRTVGAPGVRVEYESFVVDEMLPVLDPAEGGFLAKWHAQHGRDWLHTSPAAQIFLALFNDSSWPDDIGRHFHRKARNLTLDHWRKLLLGYDWRRKDRTSISSLVKNQNGKLSLRNWDPFWESAIQGYRRRRDDAEAFLQQLSHPGGGSDKSAAEFWIRQHSQVGSDIVPVGENLAGRFAWLYHVGFVKRAALVESSPHREVFLRNREAWKESLARFVASDRLHLAVVVYLKGGEEKYWGLNLDDLKARHGRFMERMHLSARCYGLEVKDFFAHLFDENPWDCDAGQNEPPLIKIPADSNPVPEREPDPGVVAETMQMEFSANSIMADFCAILSGDHHGTKLP